MNIVGLWKISDTHNTHNTAFLKKSLCQISAVFNFKEKSHEVYIILTTKIEYH